MQAFLLSLVTEEAQRAANGVLLERFSSRDNGSRLTAAEAVEALETARTERTNDLNSLFASGSESI